MMGLELDCRSFLNNGNYVVASPSWDDPLTGNTDAGAVTWCNGSIGTSGTISAINSLIGSSVDDRVGDYLIALTQWQLRRLQPGMEQPFASSLRCRCRDLGQWSDWYSWRRFQSQFSRGHDPR